MGVYYEDTRAGTVGVEAVMAFFTQWDRILADLVTDLKAINATASSSTANTTVDENTASGQKVLKVTATTGFAVGRPVLIDKSNINSKREYNTIASIQDGVSLTLEDNLTYAHTAAEGSAVEMGWFYNTMGDLRTWDSSWIKNMTAAKGCVAAVRTLQETQRNSPYGHHAWTRSLQVIILAQIGHIKPPDDEGDGEYQKLVSDGLKAILGYGPNDSGDEFTRSGNAENTRVLSHRPLMAEDFIEEDETGKPMKILPLVGVLFNVEIDYFHRYGDPHY
jgi:hypothetical protein